MDAAQVQQAALANMLAPQIDPQLAEAAWRLIASARRIVLLAHEHPDPDTLGSVLGLAHALAPLGKQCVVACADPVPSTYTFLPGREQVVSALPDETFDLVVALDAGELTRYGALYRQHQRFFDSATILNMDHHVMSSGCGVVNIIDPRSAATAELLTLFLLQRGVAVPLDAAQCLLAGLITDTRSFEFDATTARTLAVGAYLVGCGAVPHSIVKPMYRMKPLAKVRLWGQILGETLDSSADGRIVWAALTLAHLQAPDTTADMDDGLSSYLMDIDGVALAVLFKESAAGVTRVSLRTAAPYDAAAICRAFGGGGHVRAAGCTLTLDLATATRIFIPALKAALAQE